jgi:hypothetical protein
MKASELVKALEEGKLLYRIFNNDDECTLYLWMDSLADTKWLSITGWTSASKSAAAWAGEMLLHPDLWRMHDTLPHQKVWNPQSRYNKIKKIVLE